MDAGPGFSLPAGRPSVVWPLGLLLPDEWTSSVEAIDPAGLAARGIRCVLVDIDNTLVPRDAPTGAVTDRARGFVGRCRQAGLEVVLLSNAKAARKRALAAALGVKAAPGLKPARAAFVGAARLAGCEPKQAAVVGDQIWTDVLGGRRAGMYTILVNPLHGREHVLTRAGRLAERVALALLLRMGAIPPAAYAARVGRGPGRARGRR